MALPGSGPLTFQAIQDEFGSSHPISLSEYYRNGGLVPSNNTNVATSGAINVGSFYNAVNEINHTVSSGASSYNVQTAAFSSYWTTAVPKRLTINSGVALGTLTVPASMAGTLIIDHSGSIQGVGGTANGGAGATAMTVQSTGVTVNLASGSSISGGGGGGGAGGTGAIFTYYTCSSSWQQNCTQTGSCEQGDSMVLFCSFNGGGGGAGGVGQGYGQSATNGASGGGGAHWLAGNGGTGGTGASFGAAGATGSTGANSSTNSGSAGSGGGAAGRAVTFSGVSAYTIIGTNSGTINGAYT